MSPVNMSAANSNTERRRLPLAQDVGDLFRDLHLFLQASGLYLLLVILASGGMFIFQALLAGDDWDTYTGRAGWVGHNAITIGRPLHALVSRLALKSFPLHPLDTVFCYCAMVVFAFALVRHWTNKNGLRLAAISLFVTSPFFAEHLQYSINQIVLVLCFGFATLSYVFLARALRNDRTSDYLFCALCGALAAVGRNEFLLLMASVFVIEYMRQNLTTVPPSLRQILNAVVTLAVMAGFVVMIVLAVSTATGFGLRSEGHLGYSGLVTTTGAARTTLLRLLAYVKAYYFASHHLFPIWAKLCLWVMIAMVALQCARAGAWRKLGLFVLAMLALSVIPLALGLVTTNNAYRYNAVIALALVPPFVLLVAHHLSGQAQGLARTGPGRAIVNLAAAVLILISGANLAAGQVRLLNMNRLEHATLTATLGQIGALQKDNWKLGLFGKYTGSRRVVSENYDRKKPWATSIMECGILSCQHNHLRRALSLLLAGNEASEHVLELTPEDKKTLKPTRKAMAKGTAKLVSLGEDRWVLVLK